MKLSICICVHLEVLPSVLTLHPVEALKTPPSQRHTPAPHVAYFRLRTSVAGTIWTFHTTHVLVCVELRDKTVILFPRLGDFVPIRRIQRRIFRPAANRQVGISRRVLKLKQGSCL